MSSAIDHSFWERLWYNDKNGGEGMNDFEREMGARIRALRETAGYSREQLSEMADISVKFLYEIESGKKGMSALTLYHLTRALGVSADSILRGSGASPALDRVLGTLAGFSEEQLFHIDGILRQIAALTAKTE